MNYFSILSDVEWQIMLVYCLMSHGEFSRYSVKCLTANNIGILSDVSW